jgi:hypothetical protein
MSETLQVAVLTAVAALLGSVITGFITYMTAVRQREAESYKRRLQVAYGDLIAFYRLEEAYTLALATESRSAEAVKREFRKGLRDSGQDSPSAYATPTECERRLQEIQ